jgi:two-component system, LytTR family, response regulator
MMIKAVLIDDEEDGREALKLALRKFCPEIEIIGIFGSPEEGVLGIREHKPQLVFIDVQMPGMSGFDVLQKLSPVSFEVIFISAYDRYAIKAIKFSALDYLLKPIDIDELVRAVQRVKDRVGKKENNYPVQSVLHNLQFSTGQVQKLAVPSLDGVDFFNAQDVIFCKAEGSYTTIFLINGAQKVVSRNLKDFENLLSESGFCRVHHSYLINLNHVQRYVRGEGGYVVLTENHHVDISRRRKEEFLAKLDRP